MPVAVVEGSLKYCLKNKLFFIFVLLIFATLEYAVAVINSSISLFASGIASIFVLGYGLQVIEDVIGDGTRLPKIIPKKVIVFGLKGTVIRVFYLFIECLLLGMVASQLNFPIFEIEEIFSDYSNTLMLLYQHDAVSFFIFMVSGLIVSYVATFFMELALARLADGGQLRKSFNFVGIKHAIDIIGWKNYTIGYTKIILIIVVFFHINKFFDPYYGLNVIIGTLSLFVVFIIEYRGMGVVYKIYTDKKNEGSVQ